MFWISFVITLLLIIGILLIFGFTLGKMKNLLITSRNMVNEAAKKQSKKNLSIKKKIELMTVGKKHNFVARSFMEAEAVLSQTHQKIRMTAVYAISGACACIGLVIAIATKNFFIAPPLIIGLALIPTWVIKLTASSSKKQLNSELEVALSGITTSYIRSDNIISAVEENLVYINEPINSIFTKFVNENKLINSNITLGIQKMRASLDEEIFQEWCDALYQCQSDRSLKVTLFPIVNKFSETKAIQSELDTLMMMPFKEIISIIVIVVLSIPLMYLINAEWYTILVTTVPGQLIIALVMIVIVFAVNKAVDLTEPLKRDG